MREKLLNLIYDSAPIVSDGSDFVVDYVKIADHLIANGITFAEDNNVPCKWIPVSERLPEEDGSYLVCELDYKKRPYVDCVYFTKRLDSVCEYPFEKEHRPGWYGFDSAAGYYERDSVTHWLPLPELPKEGEYLYCVGIVCDVNTKPKPMTNGDRIRAMSDEELVYWFENNSLCGHMQYNYVELCETRGVCKGCVLNWLKQPAEEK